MFSLKKGKEEEKKKFINPRDFSIYQPALSRREHDERGKIHIVKKIIINMDIETIDVLFLYGFRNIFTHWKCCHKCDRLDLLASS